MKRRSQIVDSLSFMDVRVDDSFWSPRIETNREVTIEYQYDQLEESGTLENFRRAAAGQSGEFNGMWFQDSDAYKWLEAASYVLATENDPDLKERVDEVVDLVAAAQDDDGYLNTYFTLVEPDGRWTNLHMMHELYCAGHLVEAAVANHRATGDDSLLDIATAFVDHIEAVFADEDFDGAPGHEELELALVELYRVTDEERYLDLAQYFVDVRGHDADRFRWEVEHYDRIAGYGEGKAIEDGPAKTFLDDEGEYDGSYAQAHAPLDDQESVEGHSVRAMYFYAGVADLAMERDETDPLDVLDDLWQNMTQRRMYVTGGIGPEAAHEGFTEDYDLRNEDAYAETCAAIGSIFWNQRMLELTGDAKYADLIERTLYNGFLAGVGLEGKEFFYENPLESSGDHHRKGWFTCACCPPNAARLFASLGGYCYGTDGDSLFVHQYTGSSVSTEVDGTTVDLDVETDLPWSGDVSLHVTAPEGGSFDLRLRVPSWSEGTTVAVNGKSVEAATEDGYLVLDREWADDTVELTFEQTVRTVQAHPAVEADAGLVAVERGPLVYCLEATDNDRPLHQYVLPTDGEYDVDYREELLGGVSVLSGEARVPDRSEWEGELYRPADETNQEDATVTAVPYFAWDNREPGSMRVWLRGEQR